jgi:hypothetical protein
MPTVEINADFSFGSSKRPTIIESRQALNAFAASIPNALNLNQEFKFIFLDTNVLLDYYGMSKSEKIKLIEFFKNNIDRIYLPYRVQIEFMNNRLGTIKKDLFNPLGQIHGDFIAARNDIKQKYKSYLESKKKILSHDFPELWSELNETGKELEKLMNKKDLEQKVQEAVSESKLGYKDIEVVDELLELCSQFHLLETLSVSEISFIEGQYNELSVILTNAKETDKWKHVFPGSGDFGKKDYPYGDYIIFHEILKFMKDKDSNAIFLTNEKSKQDWMQKDMRPIISYIEKVYSVTNHIMFIIHAEEPLKISFENIHKPVNIIREIEKFSGIHPKYDYYIGSDETLETKASALREFIMRYKEKSEFSYSAGEGAFSSIVVTALLDGIENGYENGPKLYIQPSSSFFEHTEEGRTLKAVYHDALELWCKLEKVKRSGNDYVVFWRRSTACKIMLLEEFVEEMRGYTIHSEVQDVSPNKIYQVSATLGSFSISLNIALNPSSENELSELEQALDNKSK